MLSPSGVFGAPAAVMGSAAAAVLLYATYVALSGQTGESVIGNYWVILAGAMLGVSHVTGIIAAASHLHGVRAGYRRRSKMTARLAKWVSLETMLLTGVAAILSGLGILFAVVAYWSSSHFTTIGNVLPAVAGTSLIVIGAQNALGGFLLAILNGNEAEFLRRKTDWGESEPADAVAPNNDRRAA
jgi:hypothetical protein